MNGSSDQILELGERIRSYQAKGIDKTLSEQDTKALLVEPLLNMAGWDVADPTQVSREDRPTERPVDYSLKLDGKPKVLVECKRLSNRLDSHRDLEQALAYAAAAGVKWCVLTNGSLVRIYNSLAPEVANKKLLEELDLSKAGTAEGLPTERFMQILGLISPQSVGSGEIDRVWDRRYTGVKIRGVVEDLLTGPDPGFVNLVRRRMKEGGRPISNKQALNWLKMLEIRVRMRPLKPVREPEAGEYGKVPMSDEPGSYGDDELKTLLKKYLSRERKVPRRLREILLPLCLDHEPVKRDEIRKELVRRKEAKNWGHSGIVLSSISTQLGLPKNDYLRQVIRYDKPEPTPWMKDNYRIEEEYKSMIRELLIEIG
ncbi:MAG TPA: hypothetical protein DCP08_03375 [Chloroflexi bacterium]|nr:hypothetical protein [Chloroflexota bacterium]